MIIYIHGFASCGKGNKSQALKKYFKNEEVFAPNLPINPTKAIEFLEKFISKETILIGASLGGFYASYLAQKHNLKAVLINPSTNPHKKAKKFIGLHERYCDGKKFEVTKKDIKDLEKLYVKKPNGKYLVLLQSEDEVIDYKIALKKYKNQKVVVEYGGNHRFENINDYFSMIENFIKN
jgi:predicted esterase YcpF (UPF0227 family)